MSGMPELQKKEGSTYVSADVCWQTPLRCVCMFVNACQKLYAQYNRKMTLKSAKEDWNFDESDCTRSLETLCIAASLKVNIIVEGEDEIAETIARQLYSGLVSPSCFDFDMRKYDQK
jgi:hypothetical protein